MSWLNPPVCNRQQNGIALIMVLWLLVLMTVIASSHSRNIRTETRLASNHIESAKARGLAEAGTYHAIMEMLVSDNTDRWPVNGSPHQVQFDYGEAIISIRDTRGLMDINKVTPAVLDKVLAGAGIEDDNQRQALIDATLDWRDADNIKHLHGAEDDDYHNAGLKWAARDSAFTSIEEFRYILGMTNPLFEKLVPYLTVHSDQANIKLDVAPSWLVDTLLGTRNAPTTDKTAISAGSSTYHISVWAKTTAGTKASLDTVVHIAARGKEPYKILSWRAPARSISGNSG